MPLAERQVARMVLDVMIMRNQVAGTLERHSEVRAPVTPAKSQKPKQRASA